MTGTGNPLINIAIFGAFVLATLVVVIRVTRNSEKRAGSFYTGGAAFSGRQNGLAITGDYLSAATFLGVPGAIAISALSPEQGGTGLGLETLREHVAASSRGVVRHCRIEVPMSDAKTVSTLENRTEVVGREYTDTSVIYELRIGMNQIEKLRASGAKMKIAALDAGPAIRDAGLEFGWGR